MASDTPRFGLSKFERGDTDWTHSDLVDFVDENAIERGPISERPASGDYDDEFYFAEDQNILWRWDETAGDWDGVSGKGSEGQPLPGTVYRESVSTESLQTVADHIATSTSDLEAAFNNVAAGESIWVGQPDTPYRTSQFLDIDADGVSVQFQNQFAGDGTPVVQPADGAEVGGIRIGQNAHVTDVSVEGFGFDGNPENQSTSDPKHGVEVHDAENTRVANCWIQRTDPYHVHGGGSGITVLKDCTDIWIVNNRTDDIGDRGIQTAGSDVFIIGNRVTNGYDRGIGLDSYSGYDGTGAENGDRATVIGNIVSDSSDGSGIAVSGGSGNIPRYNLVMGNRIEGTYRGAVQFDHDSGHSNIAVGNIAYHTGADQGQPGIIAGDNDLIANNYLWDAAATNWNQGIHLKGADSLVENNYVRTNGSTNAIVEKSAGGDNVIRGNRAIASVHGIQVQHANTLVEDNVITGWTNNGIWVVSGADCVVRGNYGRTSESQNALVRNDVASTIIRDNVFVGSGGVWDMQSTPAAVGGNQPAVLLSATPTSPAPGDTYLDDGTNTGSGTLGKRVYDGSAWSDAWSA